MFDYRLLSVEDLSKKWEDFCLNIFYLFNQVSERINDDIYCSDNELDTLETYINEIVQLVADNDTYKTLSKKHWLEEMNLKYHDQVVYDYFKSNFPDLFEDD